MLPLLYEPLFWVFPVSAFSFLLMAFLIFRGARKASPSPLIKSFLVLAWFGLSHGIAEMIDWVRFIQKAAGAPASNGLMVLAQVFGLVSFVLLWQFGLSIYDNHHYNRRFVKAAPSLLAGAFLVAMWFLAIADVQQIGLWARYCLGFTGAALSAFSLYKLGETVRPLEDKKLDRGIQLAVASFTGYAIFGGLLVTPLGPVPIQFFRAGCALLMAFASFAIVDFYRFVKTSTPERV